MNNPNKWIPTYQAYPPDGAQVEALIEGKVCNVVFHDYEHARGWTIKKEEYDGTMLPTAWRFPANILSVVLKVDIENQTSQELGI